VSDTILGMTKLIVVFVTTATIAGCSNDASIKVHVVNDPDYASLVDRTEVSIYVSAGMTCDQVEFGDITAEQLLGARVAKADDGGALDNVPRVDPKLVVARGFAVDGSLVTAGCTSQGAIEGDVTVEVPTVPAATVDVALANDGTGGVIVTTTDARNDSIDGREVLWRVYGGAGTSADAASYTNVSDGVWEPKHPTCTVDGEARLHPALPTLPGGFGLRLRVGWATKPVPLFTSFTPIDSVNQLVSTLATKFVHPCALRGKRGSASIVCLSNGLPPQATEYGYDANTNTVLSGTVTSLPTGESWIGAVSVPSSDGSLFAYAIAASGTWQPLVDAPAAKPGSWCVGAQCSNADDIRIVPPCGNQPGFLLGHTNTAPFLRSQPLGGGTATAFPVPIGNARSTYSLINAGCVTELQPDASSLLRQTVVIDVQNVDALDRKLPTFLAAVFPCSASSSPCGVPLSTGGQAVAFTGGAEPQLVTTTFDASGSQLSRVVMQPAIKHGSVGDHDRTVERSRQVAAAAPHVLVTGTFDGDSEPDMMWTFPGRGNIDLQIAYARLAEGVPLSAIAPVDASDVLEPIDAFTLDFNNDGFDEIVVVAQASLLGTTLTGFAVVRMGIPYTMTVGSVQDAGCP